MQRMLDEKAIKFIIKERLLALVPNQDKLLSIASAFNYGSDELSNAPDYSRYGGESGFIVRTPPGGGKTFLLQETKNLLDQLHIKNNLLNCSELIQRGMESLNLFEIHLNSSSSSTSFTTTVTITLLDNLDHLQNDALIPRLLLSTLLSLLDRRRCSRGKHLLIATCTSSSLPPALTHCYRLGTPLTLSLPSTVDRQRILMRLFKDADIRITSNEATERGIQSVKLSEEVQGEDAEFRNFCQELAQSCQGCTLGDLIGIVRSAHHRTLLDFFTSKSTHQILKGITDSTLIPSTYLLEAAAEFNPLISPTDGSDGQSSTDNPYIVSFPEMSAPGSLGWGLVDLLVGVDGPRERLWEAVSLGEGLGVGAGGPAPVWIRPCSGILLHGPTGSGKTALAYWLARKARKRFKFLSVPCADLVHKVVGETEKKIAKIFQNARLLAPCLLLLDNLDVILGVDSQTENETENEKPGVFRRRRTGHKALDRLLSTLLVELDGLQKGAGVNSSSQEPVILIATAQNKNFLDRALLRPGRLELHISTNSTPTEAQRQSLWKKLFILLLQQLNKQSHDSSKETNSDNISNNHSENKSNNFSENNSNTNLTREKNTSADDYVYDLSENVLIKNVPFETIVAASGNRSFSEIKGLFRSAVVSTFAEPTSFQPEPSLDDRINLLSERILESLHRN